MTNKNDPLRVLDQQRNLSTSAVPIQQTRFNPYTGGTITGVENTGTTIETWRDSSLEKIYAIEFSISPQNSTRVVIPFNIFGMSIRLRSSALSLSTVKVFFALEKDLFVTNHDNIVLGLPDSMLTKMVATILTPAEFTTTASGFYTQGSINMDNIINNLFVRYTLSELYEAITGNNLPTENPAELISIFTSSATVIKVYCQIAFQEPGPEGQHLYRQFLYNLPVESDYILNPPSLWSLGLQQIRAVEAYNPQSQESLALTFNYRNISKVDVEISNGTEVLGTARLDNFSAAYSVWASYYYLPNFTDSGTFFKPSVHLNSLSYEATDKKQQLFNKTRNITFTVKRITTLGGAELAAPASSSTTALNYNTEVSNLSISAGVILDLIKNKRVFRLTLTNYFAVHGVLLVYTVVINTVTYYVHRFKTKDFLRLEPGTVPAGAGTIYYLEDPFTDLTSTLPSYNSTSTLTATKVDIYPVKHRMQEPVRSSTQALPVTSLQDYFKPIVTFTPTTKVLNFLPTKLLATLPKIYMKFTVQVQKKLLATSTTYDTLTGGTFNLVLQYNGPYTVVTVTQNNVTITSLNLKTLMASKGLYRILVTPVLTADVASVYPTGTGLVNILYTYK
jgi:hypothetical protein